MAAKRRTRKKKRKLLSPAAWLPRLDGTTVRRGAVVATWLLGIAGMVALWINGVPRLTAYAAEHGQVPGDVEIRFLDPPAWLNGELEARLLRTVRLHVSTDPMRRDELLDTRAALLNSGWFDGIRQVTRVEGGLVEVDADFVKPYAVIRNGGYDHLVDPSGRLLPLVYAMGDSLKFTVLRGVHFNGPTRPGLQWDGSDVTAGLRLLRLINTRPWRAQIAEIDVGAYMDRQVLVLVTDRGCRIVWGSAPGEERALEALADLKIKYLDKHYDLSQHVDRGHKGTLDLTSREGVFAIARDEATKGAASAIRCPAGPPRPGPDDTRALVRP